MSASTVQAAWSTADRHFDLTPDEPSCSSVVDSGIDDPVNDTGLGFIRGDLQLSDLQLSNEFACLLSMICEGRGEFQ